MREENGNIEGIFCKKMRLEKAEITLSAFQSLHIKKNHVNTIRAIEQKLSTLLIAIYPFSITFARYMGALKRVN